MQNPQISTTSQRFCRVEFASLFDFVEGCHCAEKRPNAESASQDEGARRKEWAGTYSFPEALDLARQGWQEGTESIKKAMSLMTVPEVSGDFSPAPVFAEEGDEIAVDRFLGGDSDTWVQFPMVESSRRGRVVTVCANLAVSSSVSKESFMLYGASVLAVVDSLERAGYRCEIIGVFCAPNNKQEKNDICPGFDIRFPIKHAQDPLEIDRVAFFLCHASSLRRFGFKAMEAWLPDASWNAGEFYAYGRPSGIRPEGLDDALYFAGPQHGENNAKKAAEILTAWLESTEEAPSPA